MLSKRYRLTTALVKQVFDHSRILTGEHFLLRVSPISPPFAHTKFAVVVSKKQTKTAIARNRIRRRVYTALFPFEQQTKDSYAVLVFIKKEITDCTIEQMTSELKKLLEKAGILA